MSASSLRSHSYATSATPRKIEVEGNAAQLCLVDSTIIKVVPSQLFAPYRGRDHLSVVGHAAIKYGSIAAANRD
jgi:hypothetical protein